MLRQEHRSASRSKGLCGLCAGERPERYQAGHAQGDARGTNVFSFSIRSFLVCYTIAFSQISGIATARCTGANHTPLSTA